MELERVQAVAKTVDLAALHYIAIVRLTAADVEMVESNSGPEQEPVHRSARCFLMIGEKVVLAVPDMTEACTVAEAH